MNDLDTEGPGARGRPSLRQPGHPVFALTSEP
jgi:hypothetical protein